MATRPITIKYPLDKSGVNPNNLVIAEPHTLNGNTNRAFTPTYGVFYSESLVVRDRTTGKTLAPYEQYKALQLYPEITAETGKEVTGIILITDTSVSDDVEIDYQVVGGDYAFTAFGLQKLLETANIDGRTIKWGHIVGKPSEYPPAPHLHNAGDAYGFEYLVESLEKTRQAILASTGGSTQEVRQYVELVHDEMRQEVKDFQARLDEHEEAVELSLDALLERINEHETFVKGKLDNYQALLDNFDQRLTTNLSEIRQEVNDLGEQFQESYANAIADIQRQIDEHEQYINQELVKIRNDIQTFKDQVNTTIDNFGQRLTDAEVKIDEAIAEFRQELEDLEQYIQDQVWRRDNAGGLNHPWKANYLELQNEEWDEVPQDAYGGILAYDASSGLSLVYGTNGSPPGGHGIAGIFDARNTITGPNLKITGGLGDNSRPKIEIVDGDGSGLDADLFDGLDSNQFLRSDQSGTLTGNLKLTGTNTNLEIESSSIGESVINLHGGVSRYYLGENLNYGGGLEYNRDGDPVTTGAGADQITLFRRYNGVDTWTARNFFNSNQWEFRTEPTVLDKGRILTTADEGSENGIDADTVDGWHRDDIRQSIKPKFLSGEPLVNETRTGLTQPPGFYAWTNRTPSGDLPPAEDTRYFGMISLAAAFGGEGYIALDMGAANGSYTGGLWTLVCDYPNNVRDWAMYWHTQNDDPLVHTEGDDMEGGLRWNNSVDDPLDLSQHIQLHSSGYGFSVGAGNLNIVASNGTKNINLFGSDTNVKGHLNVDGRVKIVPPEGITGAGRLDILSRTNDEIATLNIRGTGSSDGGARVVLATGGNWGGGIEAIANANHVGETSGAGRYDIAFFGYNGQFYRIGWTAKYSMNPDNPWVFKNGPLVGERGEHEIFHQGNLVAGSELTLTETDAEGVYSFHLSDTYVTEIDKRLEDATRFWAVSQSSNGGGQGGDWVKVATLIPDNDGSQRSGYKISLATSHFRDYSSVTEIEVIIRSINNTIVRAFNRESKSGRSPAIANVAYSQTGGRDGVPLEVTIYVQLSDSYLYVDGSMVVGENFVKHTNETVALPDTAQSTTIETDWHSGIMGHESGLDADLVDGSHKQTSVTDTTSDSLMVVGAFGLGTRSIKTSDLGDISGDINAFLRNITDEGWENVDTVNSAIQVKFDNSYGWRLGLGRFDNSRLFLQEKSGGWGQLLDVWHSGYQGHGTGMDTDLLDGEHGAHYDEWRRALRPDSNTAVLPDDCYIEVSDANPNGFDSVFTFFGDNNQNALLRFAGGEVDKDLTVGGQLTLAGPLQMNVAGDVGLFVNGENSDTVVWKVDATDDPAVNRSGFFLTYLGTGANNNNGLRLESSSNLIYTILQDGIVDFAKNPTVLDKGRVLTIADAGAGNGLDVDLLDGEHGAFYRNASNLNDGTVPRERLSGVYDVEVTGRSKSLRPQRIGREDWELMEPPSLPQIGYEMTAFWGKGHYFDDPPTTGGGGYVDVLAIAGYRGNGSGTGHHATQLAFGQELAFRNGLEWDTWKKLFHDHNLVAGYGLTLAETDTDRQHAFSISDEYDQGIKDRFDRLTRHWRLGYSSSSTSGMWAKIATVYLNQSRQSYEIHVAGSWTPYDNVVQITVAGARGSEGGSILHAYDKNTSGNRQFSKVAYSHVLGVDGGDDAVTIYVKISGTYKDLDAAMVVGEKFDRHYEDLTSTLPENATEVDVETVYHQNNFHANRGLTIENDPNDDRAVAVGISDEYQTALDDQLDYLTRHWSVWNRSPDTDNKWFKVCNVTSSTVDPESDRGGFQLSVTSSGYRSVGTPVFVSGSLTSGGVQLSAHHLFASRNNLTITNVGYVVLTDADTGDVSYDVYVKVGPDYQSVQASVIVGNVATRYVNERFGDPVDGLVEVPIYSIWTENNQGSDSGMDSDLVDGYQAEELLRWQNTLRVDGGERSLDMSSDCYIVISDADNALLEGWGYGASYTFFGDGAKNPASKGSKQGAKIEVGVFHATGVAVANELVSEKAFLRNETNISGNLTGDFTTTGELRLNGENHQIRRGINGGYSSTTPRGENWGANIWSIGPGYSGTGYGETFALSDSHYGLVWYRPTHPSVESGIGEGLYIYKASNLSAAFGENGSRIYKSLTVDGETTIDSKLTVAGGISVTGGDIVGSRDVTVPDNSTISAGGSKLIGERAGRSYRGINALLNQSYNNTVGPSIVEGAWAGSLVFASEGNEAVEGFAFVMKPDGSQGGDYDTLVAELNATRFNYMGHTVWHEGNQGHESGLNADLLDGSELREVIRSIGYSSVDNDTLADKDPGWYSWGTEPFTDYTGDRFDLDRGTALVTKRSDGDRRVIAFSGGINEAFIGHIWSDSSSEWGRLWHDGNHGPSSGLNADLLDGEHGAFYRNASNLNAGTLGDDRLSGNYSFGNLTLSNKLTSKGIELGYDSVSSQTDVSRHLALYGATYGLGITSDTLNIVSNNGSGAVSIQASNFDVKGDKVWHAGNSNLNTADWTVRRLLFANGDSLTFDDQSNAYRFSSDGTTSLYLDNNEVWHGGNSNNWDVDWAVKRLIFGNDDYLEYDDSSNTFNFTGDGTTSLTVQNNKVWHEGNMGHESGLNADTVDGWHERELRRSISTKPIEAMSTGNLVDETPGWFDWGARLPGDMTVPGGRESAWYGAGYMTMRSDGYRRVLAMGGRDDLNRIFVGTLSGDRDFTQRDAPVWHEVLTSRVEHRFYDASRMDTGTLPDARLSGNYTDLNIQTQNCNWNGNFRTSKGVVGVGEMGGVEGGHIGCFGDDGTERGNDIWVVGGKTDNKTGNIVFGSEGADFTIDVAGIVDNNDRKLKWYYDIEVLGNTVWHEGNMGRNSGLDADLVDGLHASQLRQSINQVELGSDQRFADQSAGWYSWGARPPADYFNTTTSTYSAALITKRTDGRRRVIVFSNASNNLYGGYETTEGEMVWNTYYHTGNTTTDSNGNLRPASPIVRVTSDSETGFTEDFTGAGSGVANAEAKGATIERIEEGVYVIKGSLGFADEGWNIVTPQDDNSQELLYVQRTVDDNDVITLRTYHRTHPDSPPFAQNNVAGYNNGDPIDIPKGRWVDLRLKMAEKPEEEE